MHKGICILSGLRCSSLAAALAALLLVASPTSAADSARPLTILALGDSLFAGYGLPAGQSVPDLLAERLRREGYPVRMVNAGISGDTTAGGLARLPWLLRERPDVAMLELGANDGLMGMPPENMEKNLAAMLDLFAEKRIPVLLAGMRSLANFGPDYAARFNAVFPRLAGKHGASFLPFLLEGVAMRPELNQADGIHPNPAGAAKVADNLYPLLKDLVDQTLAGR
ncbi:MAG: arylesterase [Thermodesulfobacteriota bacterium]